MSDLVTGVLGFGVGYLVVDVFLYAAVLVSGGGFSRSFEVRRRSAAVLLSLVVLETALLLVSTVYVAVRWPALAAFPALGACWIGADAPALFVLTRGRDSERGRHATPALVFGGVALVLGMLATFVTQARSR